jgi:hypothetical protein
MTADDLTHKLIVKNITDISRNCFQCETDMTLIGYSGPFSVEKFTF